MSDLSSGSARLPGFSTADRAPSRIAGRYDLGEVIGVGAPAWVYRAEDRDTGRVVAVKLYPSGFGGADRARRQRESGVLSGLHHPNLVELLDAGDESGRAFLVMELVEGRALSQRVLDGPMSAAEVARLGADIGYALAYLHSRGITHRAVKPSNVLMGERPMLTDYGIAALVDRRGASQGEALIGTPAYLSPEQVNGGEVGMPADVYALGLILLEALTGRREFEGDGPETAAARLSRRPAVPGDVPALTDLLHAMTAMNPAVRPTAGVVSEALRAAAPELEGVESVRFTTSGAQRPERRISTLERLEGLDAFDTPSAFRSRGRHQASASASAAGVAAAAGAAAGNGRSEAASLFEDAGSTGDAETPASDQGELSSTPAASDDAWRVPASGAPDEADRPENAEASESTDADTETETETETDTGTGADASFAGDPGSDDGPRSDVGDYSAAEDPEESEAAPDDAAGPVIAEKPAASARPKVSAAVESGTKVLDVPPVPAGLPLPPSTPSTPSALDRRDAGRRRLLAGALGLTALAAATVGVLASQDPEDEMAPAPADSAPVDSPVDRSSVVPPVPPGPPAAPVPPVAAPAPAGPPPGGNGGGDSGGGGGGKHKGGKKGKKH